MFYSEWIYFQIFVTGHNCFIIHSPLMNWFYVCMLELNCKLIIGFSCIVGSSARMLSLLLFVKLNNVKKLLELFLPKCLKCACVTFMYFSLSFCSTDWIAQLDCLTTACIVWLCLDIYTGPSITSWTSSCQPNVIWYKSSVYFKLE